MSDDRYAPPESEVDGVKPMDAPAKERGLVSRRFFALVLIVGAVVGVALLAYLMTKTGFGDAKVVGLFAGFCAMLCFTFAVGVWLWRGTPAGRRWAPILFATQVPIIQLTGFSLSWFTSLLLGATLDLGDHTWNLNLQFGAGFEFYIGAPAEHQLVGINAFALFAALWLWLRR